MLYEAFIRKALLEKDLEAIKAFKKEDFVGQYADIYEYILKHNKQYNSLPMWETVVAEFEVSTSDVLLEEPISFYADKVKKQNLITEIKGSLSVNTKSLNNDPEKALMNLKDSLKKIAEKRVRAKRGKIIRWNDEEEVKARICKMIENKKMMGVLRGIPTPWDSVNLVTNGIEKGKYWVIVAKLKTGKTWTLGPVMARYIWEQGYNVLFVTPEVSVDVLSERTDAAQVKIDYASFRKGDLDIYSEKKYLEELPKISEKENDFWIVGDGMARRVGDIEDIMDAKQPDIVMIDGAYLVEPTKRYKDKTEKVRLLSEELAILSSYSKIPIVITHQFNRSVDDESISAGADKIGSAYELAQDCDALIGLFNNTYMRRNCLMAIRVLENREGDRVNVLSNFNLESMEFNEKGVFFGDNIDELYVTEQNTQDGWL
jgi:replicative DNA helicase